MLLSLRPVHTMLFKILGIALLGLVAIMLLRRKATPARQITASATPEASLYSIPTLTDAVPKTEATGNTPPDYFRMHEDDWLQTELVAREDHDAVEAMLEHVRASVIASRVGPGFKTIFVRGSHPTPLRARKISFDALKNTFMKPNGTPRALAIGPVGGSDGIVVGGFVLVVDGLGTVYGVVEDGHVISLGIDKIATVIGADARRLLAAFTRDFSLEVVDWLDQRRIALP